ncbi:MAG: Hsp20 family protein, partial [Eubacteriales bacterium]
MAGLVPFNRKKADLVSTGFEDFYNLLDDFYTDDWGVRKSLSINTFKLDVKEEENNYIIEAELPGIKKEEIHVALDEGKLVITVSRDEKVEEEKKNYIHRERRCTSMRRSIYLTDSVAEGIKAKLE